MSSYEVGLYRDWLKEYDGDWFFDTDVSNNVYVYIVDKKVGFLEVDNFSVVGGISSQEEFRDHCKAWLVLIRKLGRIKDIKRRRQESEK